MVKSQVLELRLGKVQAMAAGGRDSAIDKQLVESVVVNELGIVGDEQAESFHGGSERALLQYDCGHYDSLRREFPDVSGCLVPGGFGENIVAAGMNEETLCIGDVVMIGDVRAQISLPRAPCFKLNDRFGVADMAHYVQQHAVTGWFYRILDGGRIAVGDEIVVIKRPNPQWSIARVMHYLYIEPDNFAVAAELSVLPALGNEIARVFAKRVDSGQVENWQGRLYGSSRKPTDDNTASR